MYYFPDLEPVSCSMSNSNCCFLTWVQISQEAGQVVLYIHLLENFLQFVVIHIVKGFVVVNKAKIDIFLDLSSFSMIQQMLPICSLVHLPFLNPTWTSGSSRFTYCWSLTWRIISCNCAIFYAFVFYRHSELMIEILFCDNRYLLEKDSTSLLPSGPLKTFCVYISHES